MASLADDVAKDIQGYPNAAGDVPPIADSGNIQWNPSLNMQPQLQFDDDSHMTQIAECRWGSGCHEHVTNPCI